MGVKKLYESTRGNLKGCSAQEAIALGMVPSGGLFVPSQVPQTDWKEYMDDSYPELARKIMSMYLQDFPEDILNRASEVYTAGIFDGSNPAPLVQVGDVGVLELWHGPTAAFKDMALQVLPHLLSHSMKLMDDCSEVLILVATSGDTGKAALEGFKNVPGTQIAVFYPEGGVSAVQKRQMSTTDGRNTYVTGVRGNFDQCQTAVKELFASSELRSLLAKKKMTFSSANSINWGRLLPQIVYYFWAYLQAVKQNKIKSGMPINIVVPTGNFGNILAAFYAKEMGLPIGQLICASNKNKVLADFFETGVYDIKREFFLTISPSMDILISSNFERFLFEASGRDSEKVSNWLADLSKTGRFEADSRTLEFCRSVMKAGWAEENEVLGVISQYFKEHNYVLDPHTAVAMKVYKDYIAATSDNTYTVIASTASPFKFASSVLQGITGSIETENEWTALDTLSELSGWTIPQGLQGLLDKPELHDLVVDPEKLGDHVIKKFID